MPIKVNAAHQRVSPTGFYDSYDKTGRCIKTINALQKDIEKWKERTEK
ncbi:MAG: hypothetical protein FWF86_08120 [Clostridia bacterium]|nr:hypothetical protein [Clostridia bacterium]